MRSYVLIEAVISKARPVAVALKKIEDVSEVHLITGPYDIIAVVETDSYQGRAGRDQRGPLHPRRSPYRDVPPRRHDGLGLGPVAWTCSTAKAGS